MDVYGFQHAFADEGLMLHYLCTQLHQHYQRAQQQNNKERWKLYLKANQGVIVNCVSFNRNLYYRKRWKVCIGPVCGSWLCEAIGGIVNFEECQESLPST